MLYKIVSAVALLGMATVPVAHADCSPQEIIALSKSGYNKTQIDALCEGTPAGQADSGYRDIAMYEVPKGLELDGRIIKSATWTDKLGVNYLFITESGIYPVDAKTERNCDDESYCNSAHLHGYHFVDNGNGPQQLWKIHDYINGCSFDITLDYLQGSLALTDLDNDGINETSFLYRLACRSDVSGADMKLMMHEGKPKYAIRGLTRTPYEPGEMRVDPSFEKAPASFRSFAVERWRLFDKEFFEYFDGNQ